MKLQWVRSYTVITNGCRASGAIEAYLARELFLPEAEDTLTPYAVEWISSGYEAMMMMTCIYAWRFPVVSGDPIPMAGYSPCPRI